MSANLPSLYIIADEYRRAADELADLDLPPEVVADTLEGMSGDLEAKSTNVAMFVRNLEAMAEQIKIAETEMAKRRKAIEARAERVRDYILSSMRLAGISKIECPYFKLAIRSNPPSVVIDDAGAVPCDLYVYPEAPPPYPDKKAIKAAIESGQEVRGAHLEHSQRLEIK
jgi:hypothetical protein